jgi:hypothetical protein
MAEDIAWDDEVVWDTPPKQPQGGLGRGVGLAARAGINAVAGLPAMLADAPVALGNLASAAMGGKTMQLPSQALQGLMTQAGLPEPSTTAEKALSAGLEAAGGTKILADVAKKAGSALLQPFTKNVPAQVAASGATGAVAAPVSEKVTEETESPVAGLVAALALGLPAGSIAGKAVQGAQNKTPLPSLADIKKRAQERYAQMSSQGIELKNSSVSDMIGEAENTLLKSNLNPKLDTHKPIATVLEDWKEMAGKGNVSFDRLEQMRSKMNELRSDKDAATRRLASIAVDELDNFVAKIGARDVKASQGSIDEAVKSVVAARKDWRNLSRAQVLEDALNVAEAKALDPKASEGELIRRQLLNLVANKNKMRMFSEREQNAIKAAAKGRSADPLLSLAARFNPERSQIVAGGSLLTTAANPAVGLGIAGTGYAADKTLSAMRRKDLEKLVKQVGSGNLPPESVDTLYSRMFGVASGVN